MQCLASSFGQEKTFSCDSVKNHFLFFIELLALGVDFAYAFLPWAFCSRVSNLLGKRINHRFHTIDHFNLNFWLIYHVYAKKKGKKEEEEEEREKEERRCGIQLTTVHCLPPRTKILSCCNDHI
jgi:hypothetical protein